ncbi:flagellar protein FliS [Aeromonas diversa CDC 2478-85]|uniref:Flagellar secretion chaperone FliS n=1 Tax=Aeromonas diversa CDC 2478-85 TaxID=1268237 RepID=N9VK03_9GAMM|nr:flagellar export chaperone FliS [Aeromonas diversa]ENY71963.1 flagellar protein FliS [Aeromonas diversa CDC 2478-85]
MYNKRSINAYKSQSLEAELSVADPHRIIQLLMQGLLERLALTKGAIERRDLEEKADKVSKSMAIIMGLQDSLDFKYDDISKQLYESYEFMKQRLLDASRDMDPEPVQEIIDMMLVIKSAWDAIPLEEREKAYAMRQENR